MAGFGAFLTLVFFYLPQEEEKNLQKIFNTSIIFDFISNYTNCDWILEKRSKSHIRSFEINGFKELKPA